MISKRFLDSLSPEHKELITTTFDEIKLYERKLIRDGEKEILAKLEEKGVTVTVLTEEERQRWAEATAVVYSEYEDRIGKELIEEAKATIAGE